MAGEMAGESRMARASLPTRSARASQSVDAPAGPEPAPTSLEAGKGADTSVLSAVQSHVESADALLLLSSLPSSSPPPQSFAPGCGHYRRHRRHGHVGGSRKVAQTPAPPAKPDEHAPVEDSDAQLETGVLSPCKAEEDAEIVVDAHDAHISAQFHAASNPIAPVLTKTHIVDAPAPHFSYLRDPPACYPLHDDPDELKPIEKPEVEALEDVDGVGDILAELFGRLCGWVGKARICAAEKAKWEGRGMLRETYPVNTDQHLTLLITPFNIINSQIQWSLSTVLSSSLLPTPNGLVISEYNLAVFAAASASPACNPTALLT
ncbi:hypothetical protein HYPSUDRAFT_207847 [Hypholoma sublateritium FD-334 SS-4]|uniref:Uncharacterized protein n=1 Tax=Hypholoma sublateritium (strain FD-334 SS-4) TaxID=945553 RepID=A0A0D2KLC5_HYPSF|nr:hypothetical protein HYPSUDRAFT_207993 [Hypholoma sublateritium FD-334 SS-4]KJA15427.1 hypothetical protein HYPSUDRAFT_207847 [Hypholoma sublateritium FD-334 SS-4]